MYVHIVSKSVYYGLHVRFLGVFQANNCAINTAFKRFRAKFMTLYRRKVYTHHYTEYMDAGEFDEVCCV